MCHQNPLMSFILSQLRCVSTACAMIVPSSSAVSEFSTLTRLLFTRPPPTDLCQRLPCPYPPIPRRRTSCYLIRVNSELTTKIRAKGVFLNSPTLLTCTLPSMNLRRQRWLARRLPTVRLWRETWDKVDPNQHPLKSFPC